MIENFRHFMKTSGGKIVAVAASVVLVVLCVYVVRQYLKGDSPDEAFFDTYVDTDTGKPFKHRNEIGETFPILSPSGKKTGYPGEACYWTKEGSVKTEPTWVVLNLFLGKEGPTFCPDCGRLVVGHNPPASADRRPPPTESEMLHSSSQ